MTAAQQAHLNNCKTPGSRCSVLGTYKHECVEEVDGQEDIRCERSYDTKARPPRVLKNSDGTECFGYDEAKASAIASGIMQKGRIKRPDAIVGKRAPYAIFDAKFPCSKKVKSGNFGGGNVHLSAPGVKGVDRMTSKEKNIYPKIANGKAKTKGTVTPVAPADAVGLKCP